MTDGPSRKIYWTDMIKEDKVTQQTLDDYLLKHPATLTLIKMDIAFEMGQRILFNGLWHKYNDTLKEEVRIISKLLKPELKQPGAYFTKLMSTFKSDATYRTHFIKMLKEAKNWIDAAPQEAQTKPFLTLLAEKHACGEETKNLCSSCQTEYLCHDGDGGFYCPGCEAAAEEEDEAEEEAAEAEAEAEEEEADEEE